jgi:diguanylate cyclase (GGDEF)-like protein
LADVKILCVEDDENLAKLLKTTLVSQHFQVEVALDGQSGWDLAEIFPYDLILLDLILPKLDGIRFCQQLRSNQSSTLASLNRDTPVLLMTALDAVTNKVLGLDAGADDYVTKPLDLDELMARIRALLRRNQVHRSPLLEWGALCLNPHSCEVRCRGQLVALTSKEYEILELFLRNPDQIFSPSRLLDRLWTCEDVPTEGTVRSHMKGLRQKLKQAGSNDIFETLYKLGYRLKAPLPIYQADGEGKEERKDREDLEVSPPASPSSPSFSIAPDLWAVWQECRQDYCNRLSVVTQAAVALQAGTLTQQEKQTAEREAHTLIGSLGSFGLHEASRLVCQLLQQLKQEEPWGQASIEQLLHLIAAFQQQIEVTVEQPQTLPFAVSLAASSATVLLVDDDTALAKQLAVEATAWDIQAKTAISLEQARQSLSAQKPDAILLNLNFSDSSKGGLAFLAELRTQYIDLPVLVFTAEETLTERVEAARLGCQCFLQKPIAPAQLLAAVAQVLQQSDQGTGRLLIVDDDPNLLRLLHTLLTPHGYQLTLLDQPENFWQTLEQTSPDLVILDVDLHSDDGTNSLEPLSGIDLCKVIRSDPRWNRLPVLFLSAHTDAETIHQGFAARADDFLSKPVVATDLLTRIQARLEQRKLRDVADIDELTGVSLRRKTLQDLNRLMQLAKRQQQPFSVAILDLDHFKCINDQYGHKAGDRVLNYLGRLLLRSFRAEDVVGRWGGEEFVVGMYNSAKQDGMKRLGGVLQQLSQHMFIKTSGVSFSVTFSAGIAQFAQDGNDWQTLYQMADAALYRAKAQGRNQIVAAET